jgi:hypothetical protein
LERFKGRKEENLKRNFNFFCSKNIIFAPKMKPVLNEDKDLAILKSDHLRTRLQLQVSCRKEGEYASSRTPSALSLRHPAAP